MPSSLWSLSRSLRILPSLTGSRLTNFYGDASPALLQLVNQWLYFIYSRSNAFRYGGQNKNSALKRIELTTSALAGVQVTYYDSMSFWCTFVILGSVFSMKPSDVARPKVRFQ